MTGIFVSLRVVVDDRVIAAVAVRKKKTQMSSPITATYADGITLTIDADTVELDVDGTKNDRWTTSDAPISHTFNGSSGAEYVLDGLAIRESGADDNSPPIAPTSMTGGYNYAPPATLTKTHVKTPYVMLGAAAAAILFVTIVLLYRGRSRFFVGLQRSMGVARPDLATGDGPPAPAESTTARKIRMLPLYLLAIGGAGVYALAALRQKYPNTIRIGNEASGDLGAAYGWRVAAASAYLPLAKMGLFNVDSDEATAVSTWCERGTVPTADDLVFLHNAIAQTSLEPGSLYKCLRCNYYPKDPTTLDSTTMSKHCDCASISSSPVKGALDYLGYFNQYFVPPLMLVLPFLMA